MYIIKNALRCIGRSKGRNILIGIIALVIAVSACIGLSIRQASESAKASALDGMSVTATISYDRASAMGNMAGGRPSGSSGGSRPNMSFDKNQFANMMGSASSLTLDEYKKYAEAKSVDDFYYTLTAYFNGSESFSAVTDEVEEEKIDAFCALAGCGPAYVYMFIDALASAAESLGIDRERALVYASKMTRGATKMVLSYDDEPTVLRDKVCSPGGATIEGVKSLDSDGFTDTVKSAILAAYKRTLELGK